MSSGIGDRTVSVVIRPHFNVEGFVFGFRSQLLCAYLYYGEGRLLEEWGFPFLLKILGSIGF